MVLKVTTQHFNAPAFCCLFCCALNELGKCSATQPLPLPIICILTASGHEVKISKIRAV